MDDMSEAVSGVEGAALRDAAEILALVEADEQAAVRARRELRDGGLPRMLPHPEIEALLEPGETVVEVRTAVVLERHVRDLPAETASGRLYLTSRRLVLVGRRTIDACLVDVEELSLAAERLLVTLRDGTGLSLDAGRPRLLRVQVAAAIEAARYRSPK
jgi:hypothetical protein